MSGGAGSVRVPLGGRIVVPGGRSTAADPVFAVICVEEVVSVMFAADVHGRVVPFGSTREVPLGSGP